MTEQILQAKPTPHMFQYQFFIRPIAYIDDILDIENQAWSLQDDACQSSAFGSHGAEAHYEEGTAMVVRKTTSVFWSWVWLIGWVILLGLLIVGATTTNEGIAAAIIAGITIEIAWIMALVRGAQEKRWIFFTFMLLLGNALGPFMAVYYVWRTYTDLTRA